VPPWVVLPADRAAAFDVDCAQSRQTLAALYAELSPHGEGLAVRSSGLSEDQSGASAAGIYESVFCTNAEDLPKALENVFNSANAKRVEVYRCTTLRGPMAVILQQCIKPILSGVAFSAHPSHARYDRVLIEAVQGACAALVDGTASPSRFEVDVVYGETVSVEPSADGPATLDKALAESLRSWLLKLEDVFDGALDIEWATDASGLWLLQARPITRLALDPSLRPPMAATSWFFDQRFHEPIHPITRTSLLPLILRTGIDDALRLRGLPVPEPLRFDYAGQCYVNLEAYHRLLRHVPGWLLTPDLRQLFPDGSDPGRIPGLSLLWTGLPILWRERGRAVGNVGAWDRFRDGLSARLDAIPEAHAEDMDAWRRAWQQLDALTEEFLRLHRWSIVLADYAYNAFLLLTGPLPTSLRERKRQGLLQQARLITADANAAREAACEGDEAAMEAFLRAYGHRSASLDYAAPTWAEILSHGDTTSAAEAAPAESCPSRKILVRLLEMREEQRFHWERILARQRALLLDAGRTLEKKGLLTGHNEIWWLEWDEVQRALAEGDAPDPKCIAQRRRAHRINVPVRRPTHIAPGNADHAVGKDASHTLHGVGASSGTARGVAFVVRQLKDLPDSVPQGAILVLPCLDPAWTPILRHVAGLVIERGGLLSHVAIIAREYGIPLVIGVPEATERVRTGDVIEVDGDMGVVRIE